jgi:hypothetical protein
MAISGSITQRLTREESLARSQPRPLETAQRHVQADTILQSWLPWQRPLRPAALTRGLLGDRRRVEQLFVELVEAAVERGERVAEPVHLVVVQGSGRHPA